MFESVRRRFGPARPGTDPAPSGGGPDHARLPLGLLEPADGHALLVEEPIADRIELRSDVLDAMLRPDTIESELLSVLRTRIQDLHADRPFRCLGMVSATSGEGKTTIATATAFSLARQRARRVLLIEADLRKPTIERVLGLESRPGLREYLQGEVEEVRLRRLLPDGLFLLGAGLSGVQAADALASERTVALLAAARSVFDVIVVDCPPLIPLADAMILEPLLDGFLLVVRADRTPRETLARAVGQLRRESIRGVILNDQRELLRRVDTYAYESYTNSQP